MSRSAGQITCNIPLRRLPAIRSGLTVIWLENPGLSFYERSSEMMDRLCTLKNCYILRYTTVSKCIKHLKRARAYESLILIIVINGAHFDASKILTVNSDVSQFSLYRQVKSIFLFSPSTREADSLTKVQKDITKLTGIFYDHQSMFFQLQQLISEIEESDDGLFSTFNRREKALRDVRHELGAFVWSHSYRVILNAIPRDSSQAKREMLAECRAYYHKNQFELAAINDFGRTYCSANAIYWYTKPGFLFHLVNKALRTEDIRALYRFRFFILDMCKCLEEETVTTSTYFSTPFRVYRGSKLGRDEVEQLRVDTLVATNGFLSTSRDLSVAQAFIGIDPVTGMSLSRSRADRRQYVLFEIDIDWPQSPDIVVADVSGHSAMADENEMIFSLGTTFIITQIMYDVEKYLWRIRMVSSSEVAELNRHYNQYVYGHLTDVNATLLFGQFLAEISGDYIGTITYFHRLLRRLSADDQDRPNIYYYLGRAYRFIGKYQQAITYFRCAQLLQRRKVPQWSFDYGRTLGVLGTVYSEMGDLARAIRLEEKALVIHSGCLAQDHVEMVDNWNRLAYAYWQEKKYERALVMLSNSLSLSKRKMPYHYPNHAQAVCTMGLVQYALGNRDEAISYLKQALQMRESLLADDHPAVARTCYELGIIYAERENEHILALDYAQRALRIQEAKLPPNHRELILTKSLVERMSKQNNVTTSD